MAFSMNSMSAGFGASSDNVTIHQGDDVPEVPDILTEEVGFKGLNGDKKARILKEAWPDDDLPPPYASLLSIAPARGLYAAASPTSLVIGKTDKIRTQIYSQSKSQDIFDCEPLQSFPHPRLSQVAFASDEACLVVAEQASSQIIAYDVKGLVAGSSNLKVTLSTSSPVRTVLPNPDPSQAHLFALLNADGQLLLANLQGNAELVTGANGPVLAEGVACLAWSTKGKQLLAGKADGTAIQIKPDGTVVARIPKPDSVPQDCHLAQIVWTETDVFIFIYTPSNVAEDDAPESHYFVVKTNKGRTQFAFRKTASDIVFPTIQRHPAYFHTARLRDYGPALDELICVTATVSSDVKMIAKSKKPLSGETSEENAYVIAMPDNESLQATMPMKEDASADTTAIGMAFDLSDSEPILLPILNDPEITQSDGPLPLLLALNNEGILRVWAVIYNEAVREKVPYPGFAEVKRVRDTIGVGSSNEEAMDTADSQPSATQNQPQSAPNVSTPSAAPSSVTTDSPFKMPSLASPTFGAGGGFSKPTPISNETKSSWTSTGFTSNSQTNAGGFGAPGFGTTPALGSNMASAFGRPGTMGGNALQTASSPAFGKTGFGATSQSSPFASAGNSSSSPFGNLGSKQSSGFSSFANQNGFGSTKTDTKTESSFGTFSGGSGFATASGSSSFFGGSASKSSNTFGQTTGASEFGKPSPIGGSSAPATSPFGTAGKSAFKLDSTFHKDETSKDEDDKADDSGFGLGGFGNMFGSGRKEAAPATDKETEMGDDEDETAQSKPAKKPQETPPSTLNQPKTTTTPHVSSLFGNTQQQQTTTPPTQQKASTGWGFGNIPSTTPKDTPAPSKFMFPSKSATETTPALVGHGTSNKPFASVSNVPKINDQPFSLKASDGTSSTSKIPDAPLPPDPFSKPGYQTGDTSASSINSKASREPEDAPLPPDFVAAGKNAVQSVKTEESELPTDDLSSDFGQSGDDLTGDISAAEDDRESARSDEDDEEGDEEEADEDVENVQTSPESSFGHAADQSPVASPTGGPFTKVNKVEAPKQMKPLFGEMGKPGPIFAPPKPQPHQSPRSPSPVRKSMGSDLFQSTSRSVSAPAGGQAFLQQKKMEHQSSPFAMQAAKAREEETAREAARAEAARRVREEAEARELEPLVDDEDTIIRHSLARDPEPTPDLDPFLTIQPVKALQDLSHGRSDIHSQIEILYEDINAMVNTLGINARSLKEYMMYQNRIGTDQTWLNTLKSDTPMDVVNDELFLSNINSLPAGCTILGGVVASLDILQMEEKLDQCQHMLTQELTDLRARIIAMRRSGQARAQSDNDKNAPLTAEQASIRQDLRKSSSSVLTSLVRVEEELVMLRAKLADLAPVGSPDKKSGMSVFGLPSQKKPSVEAVINTVTKMTAMAERKSADVDVLEAQMRKLRMSGRDVERPSTPERRITRKTPTPGSGASTVFLTPESRGARSVRATPSRNQQLVVSAEDREKWQAKAKRKKNIAVSLKAVLQAKQENAA